MRLVTRWRLLCRSDTEPVQKITIVPRTMGSLGYVMQTPEEEKFLMTKAELESELVTLLAGRASEEIFFESVSTGASNDIEKATKIARSMVTRFGMSDEFGLMGLETIQGQYLDGRAVLNCGEQTAAKVDIVVMGMLKEAYEKAKALISSNKMAMNRIAAFLIEKETITGKEFMKILQEVQDEEKQLEAEAERKMQEAREQEAEEQDASGSAAKEPKDAGLGEVWTDSGETSVFEQPKVDLKKELKAEAEKEKEETAQEDSVQE